MCLIFGEAIPYCPIDLIYEELTDMHSVVQKFGSQPLQQQQRYI